MRILQIVPSLETGGAERMAALLAELLAERGHQVGLVSLGPSCGSWIEAHLKKSKVKLFFLDKPLGLSPRILPRLARIFASFKPQVLHTHLHTLKYVLPAKVFAPQSRTVHTLHNLAQYEIERSGQLLHRLAFKSGTAPVAIGEAVADSIRELYHCEPRAIIPNGIPVADFKKPPQLRSTTRASLKLGEETPVFLAIGRLNPQKNHSWLLQAFAVVKPEHSQLLIAGDGELRSKLVQQAQVLGIAKRVQFLGVRSDIPALLAAADVVVLPSRYEGNPLVVLEAMAAGHPVIASAVGCVPELISESCGRLVAPQNTSALVAALNELASTPTLAKSLGLEASRLAHKRFDAAIMANAYEKLFAEVIPRSDR